MTDEDGRLTVLRSTLAELERTAPMPHDLIDRVVERAHAGTNAPVAPRRGWRWLAPVAAAAAVAVVAGLIAIIRTGHSGPAPTIYPPATPVPVAQWLTFRAPGFEVRYPPTWQPYPADYASSFDVGITYFSSQHVPSSCHTSRGGSEIRCGTPVIPLRDGGVLVSWDRTSGFPAGSPPINGQPGRPSAVDGHRAKIAITAPKRQTSCARSGGTREVAISIAAARYILVDMTACLAGHGPQLDTLTQTVITSARTLRLNH